MYAFRIRRSPDADLGGGASNDGGGTSGAESTPNDSSGSSTPKDHSQQNQPNKERDQGIFNKGYADGITKGTRDAYAELARELGIDLEATKDVTTAVRERVASKKGEGEAKDRVEVDRIAQQAQSERDARLKAENDLANYIARSEVMMALSRYKVLDAQDAMNLFMVSYKVGRTADGSVKVYNLDGSIVRNADFKEATVSEVLAEFFKNKKYLLEPQGNQGGGGSAINSTGIPDDLAEKMKTATPSEKWAMMEEIKKRAGIKPK